MLQRSTVTPYAFCCGLRRTARSYMSGCCGDEAESSTGNVPSGFAVGDEPWALGLKTARFGLFYYCRILQKKCVSPLAFKKMWPL